VSISLLEIVEAAGYNPRNPDDAARLRAIVNDDDIEHLREIISNTLEQEFYRVEIEDITEQLDDIIPSGEAGSDYQVLKREIEGHQQTLDELIKEGEKL